MYKRIRTRVIGRMQWFGDGINERKAERAVVIMRSRTHRGWIVRRRWKDCGHMHENVKCLYSRRGNDMK